MTGPLWETPRPAGRPRKPNAADVRSALPGVLAQAAMGAVLGFSTIGALMIIISLLSGQGVEGALGVHLDFLLAGAATGAAGGGATGVLDARTSLRSRGPRIQLVRLEAFAQLDARLDEFHQRREEDPTLVGDVGHAVLDMRARLLASAEELVQLRTEKALEHSALDDLEVLLTAEFERTSTVLEEAFDTLDRQKHARSSNSDRLDAIVARLAAGHQLDEVRTQMRVRREAFDELDAHTSMSDPLSS